MEIQASNKASPMIEHMTDYHKESQMAPNYKVEMVMRFTKLMECQIYKGIRIKNSKAIVINRKGEWGQNLPPRFEIEDPKKQRFKGRKTH